jgi:hypothetical protein
MGYESFGNDAIPFDRIRRRTTLFGELQGRKQKGDYIDVPLTNVQKMTGPKEERVRFSNIPMMRPRKNIMRALGIAPNP